MAEEQRHKRRRILIGAGGSILLLIVLLIVVFETPWGQRQLVRYAAARVAAATGYGVDIEGVGGWWPWSFVAGKVTLSDERGEWLLLENVGADLTVGALLRRSLYFSRLGVERATLLRLPVSEEEETREPFELRVPAIPQVPRWLTIESAEITELIAEEDTFGQRAVFRAQGGMKPEADGSEVLLEAARTDGPEGVFQLETHLTEQQAQVRVELLDEAIVPGLFQLDPPLRAALQLDGAKESIEGVLDASIADAPIVQANIIADSTEALTLSASGKVHWGNPIFPAAVAQRFGEAGAFTVKNFLWSEGTLSLDRLHLQLPPAEAQENYLEATLRYTPEADDIELRAQLEHQDLDLLLEREGTGRLPLSASVTMQGTRQALALYTRATVDGAPALEGDANLALGDQIALKGAFNLYPVEALAGAETATLFREGLDIDLDVAYARDEVLTLRNFALRAEGTDVSATGTIELQTREVQLDGTVHAQELARFSALLPVEVSGGLDAAGSIAATNAATRVEGRAELAGLRIGEAAIGAGSLEVSVTGGPWPDDVAQQLDATVRGTLDHVQMRQYAAERILVSLEAAPQSQEEVLLRDFSVSDGNLRVNGEGLLRPRSGFAEITVTAEAPDLAQLAALLEQPYGGALQAEARITRAAAESPWSASLNGIWQEPTGLPDALSALLGSQITFSGDARYDGVELSVAEAMLQSGGMRAGGNAEYIIDSRAISADLELEAPDLAALRAALDQEIAGSVRVNANIDGMLDDFDATGTAMATNLTYGEARAEAVEAEFDLTGLPESPGGAVQAQVREEGQQLEMNTGFALADRALTLRDLALALGPNAASGTAQWNLDTREGSATLSLNMPQLAAFAPMTGIEMAGAVSGDLHFAFATETLGLEGSLDGAGIRLAAFSAESVTLAANLRRESGTPRGEALLNAQNATVGAARWDTLALELRGSGDALEFDAQGRGTVRELPAEFEAAGSTGFSPNRLALERFRGNVETLDFALRAPASLTVSEDAFTLTPLELAVAGGTITAEGAMTGDAVNASARWENLNLGGAEGFGGPPVSALLNGQLTVTGTPAQPVFRANLQARDVLSTRYENVPAPPATLSGEFITGPDGVTADARVAVGETADAAVNLRAPLRLSLRPFEFELPQQGPLAGTITVRANMAEVSNTFGVNEHLMRGNLNADIAIAGVVADPVFSGSAAVVNGRYENTETGTILENLQLQAEAQDDRLRILQFQGQDADGGTLQLEGHVLLAPQESFPFDMRLVANEFQLIRRDDLTGTLTGEVAIDGNKDELLVKGAVTASPAIVNVPERLPAEQLRSIEVVEVNRDAAGLAPLRSDEEREKPLPTIRLDVELNLPGEVYVRGRGLDSEWTGRLHVTGTADDPRLAGPLRVVKGRFEFLSREFDLRDSTLTFDRDAPPSPYCNVTAVSRSRDITAIVRIRGEFDDLEITMESDPPLPEDEVLAHVLFNRNLSEVSPLQAIQLARAAAQLQGGSSGFALFSDTLPVPGLDLFNLREGRSPGDTAVGFGKALGDKIYVDIEQGVGVQDTRLKVELELNPNFSVEAEAGATSGGGIFYKKDY